MLYSVVCMCMLVFVCVFSKLRKHFQHRRPTYPFGGKQFDSRIYDFLICHPPHPDIRTDRHLYHVFCQYTARHAKRRTISESQYSCQKTAIDMERALSKRNHRILKFSNTLCHSVRCCVSIGAQRETPGQKIKNDANMAGGYENEDQ